MVEQAEKQPSHHRSSRQIRPILGSIIFLLAANLVAKGALGLGQFGAPVVPNIPGNIQGSLYLSVNNPNEHHANSHLQSAMSAPYISHTGHGSWYPLHNSLPYALPYGTTTHKPRPVNQQQIVNIRDPLFESEDDYPDVGQQQVIVNKGSKGFDLDMAASDESQVKVSAGSNNTETETEKKEESEDQVVVNEMTTPQIPPDVEILPNNFTGRQNAPTTLPPTLGTPTTMRPTVAMTTPPNTPTPTLQSTTIAVSNTSMNNTGPGYGYGYGPSGGYDNVTFTTPGPTGIGNMSVPMGMLQPPAPGNDTNSTVSPTYGAPNYPPFEGYGPSNGNEHVSITYGPPPYRPFFSSPEDPYLNTNNRQYYNSPPQPPTPHIYNNNHFYQQEHRPDPNYNQEYYSGNSNPYPQVPQIKYNDLFSKFYNKFDYHYPSFYNNYVNK